MEIGRFLNCQNKTKNQKLCHYWVHILVNQQLNYCPQSMAHTLVGDNQVTSLTFVIWMAPAGIWISSTNWEGQNLRVLVSSPDGFQEQESLTGLGQSS